VNRKLASASAILAVSALALAACGGADPEPDAGGADGSGDELQFLFWNWGPDAEPGWRSIADEFEAEHNDVTVDLTPVSGQNWGEYLSNAATMIAGGASPDLIYTATEGVKFLLLNDMILPIDEYLAADDEAQALVDDMAPNLVDGLRDDGSLYALPYAWNNMVIYYNTDRFAEVGLEPPAPDWTIEEFVETAKALTEDTDGDGQPDRYGYAWDSNELFAGVTPWVMNFGGSLASEDLCTATVDSPEVVDAISFLHDLIYTHGVSPAPIPLSEIFPQFQNGDIAMFGAGRWPLASLLPEGFEAFDIQIYPEVESQTTLFGVGGFPILKSSENPELAFELAKFASSPEIQSRAVGTEQAPATDIPALRSVAAEISELGLSPANSALYYESVEEYDAALVPAPAAFAEFENTIIRNLALIMADELSVTDGLGGAQSELESVVNCD